jgi:hypothetical protein
MSAARAMSDDAKTATTAAAAQATSDDKTHTTTAAPSNGPSRARQLRVMLGWQWLVRKRSIGQNVQLFVAPIIAFILTWLIYFVFVPGSNKGESTGMLELIFVPLGLIFFLVSGTVTLVAEKAARLVETMKIMSLKESIKIGDVFDALQARKEEVDLVDYSIAQPTLEAVFIRTVLDYSGDERPDLPDNTGARTRLLSQSVDSTDGLDEVLDDALAKKKFTGCTRRVHYIMAVVCFIIAIILLLASGAAQFLFIIAIVFLLAMIWGCVGCCCILKKDKYEDDGVTCSDRGDAGLWWWCEP